MYISQSGGTCDQNNFNKICCWKYYIIEVLIKDSFISENNNKKMI